MPKNLSFSPKVFCFSCVIAHALPSLEARYV
jgi:hypothetical protein